MRLGNVRIGDEVFLVTERDGRLFKLSGPQGEALRSTDDLLAGGWDVRTLEQVPLGASAPTFLPAVTRPEKVLCVGRNYLAHIEQEGAEVPQAPCLFAKFPSSLTGHDAVVVPPEGASQMDYEGELAVIVGRTGKDIPEGDALSYVFGYTVANDLSARDLQFLVPQWLTGKAPDGFCPLGPWVVTADEIPDPQSLALRTFRGGHLVQDGHTSRMICKIPYLLSYVSRFITLRPGDVMLTGTPEGVEYGKEKPRWLEAGETVEVEVERVGRLRTVIGS